MVIDDVIEGPCRDMAHEVSRVGLVVMKAGLPLGEHISSGMFFFSFEDFSGPVPAIFCLKFDRTKKGISHSYQAT
jgi:hypothetical protein